MDDRSQERRQDVDVEPSIIIHPQRLTLEQIAIEMAANNFLCRVFYVVSSCSSKTDKRQRSLHSNHLKALSLSLSYIYYLHASVYWDPRRREGS